MKNTIKVTGTVHIKVTDRYGNIKIDKDLGKNIITTVGKAAIAGLVGNTGSVSAFTYLAVGTSSTAVAVGDTTLTAEVTDSGLERASATVSRVTTTVTNDTIQLAKTWTATAAKTIEECGALNASSSGVLLGHKLTGSVALTITDTLTITYQIAFS